MLNLEEKLDFQTPRFLPRISTRVYGISAGVGPLDHATGAVHVAGEIFFGPTFNLETFGPTFT